ncbi:protein angel homolog 1 isoform X2 [Mugil cephalus]|uniref:protein angel homolog 1 isoform X2 n=1 Tax=Mugil cephalus TaxID=48193 RepID=UPI001FB61877|nr:protein angel homolog 1 isoform X2 [Mugil cephalus]
MIGILLCYVLYPFSRYLSRSRASEASKKGLPPAIVNGTAVRDGVGAPASRFTHFQSALVDQFVSSASGSKGETKERVKELSRDKQDQNIRPDMDRDLPMGVFREGAKIDATSDMGEVRSAGKEEEEGAEKRDGPRQEKVEGPDKEDEEITMLFKMKTLQTEGRQESTCPVQEPMPTLEESLSTEDKIQEIACAVEKQIQIPNMEMSPTTPEVTECWDEYPIATADETPDGASTWPGLAQEVHCPPCNFPFMSYYPPVEPTVPFEVVWRAWDELDDGDDATQPAPIPPPIPSPHKKVSVDFTVMSYNILAQDLLEAHQELYAHCPLEVLDWSYRLNLLLCEIQTWSPHILCLQEVQENHYHEQLHPVLSQMGYNCVYKRRTGTKADGCATCYRSSCFTELAVTEVEFFRPETELLNRHNVGIVVLLRPVVTQGSEVKEKAPPLCLANTHLLFNPKRGDVKLAQLAIMLAEIDRAVKSCRAKGEHCNVILCGDFNSVPGMPLYQLITTGKLTYEGLPAWMISGQEDLSYKPHYHTLSQPLWPSSVGITANCQYTNANEVFESLNQKSAKYRYRHDFMLQLRYCPASCVRPDLPLIPGATDKKPVSQKLSVTGYTWSRSISTFSQALAAQKSPPCTLKWAIQLTTSSTPQNATLVPKLLVSLRVEA